MAAARTTANVNATRSMPRRWAGHRLGLSTSSKWRFCAGRVAWQLRRAPAALHPVEPASAKPRAHRALFVSPLVAQAVLVEACSRKEFFDELTDNLEARSERYTPQSGPGIIALIQKRVFQWLAAIRTEQSRPPVLR